ncbi:MAG TPA: ribose-phosphate pyrophosphokinase [Stellaceae bacterium]|nr:ribose-phosphate pyrophosphokinase [Stellaceae bacterium]
MTRDSLALFSLTGTVDYAQRVAGRLETPLAPVEERPFEDGEHKVRPLVAVEGDDCFVLHALYGDETQSVNDKLCRLLFLIATLKDHGAARVTAVLPYLCYARKDRRTQPHDPVTSRYVAALFEAVGTDRVLALEVHNEAAFENGFRCPTGHLTAADLFAEHFARIAKGGDINVVSPDAGGVKRAEHFRRALQQRTGRQIDSGFVEKYRSGGVVSGGTLVGAVAGKSVILLDDLISTGTTLLRAARACREAGAAHVYGAATHGVFPRGGTDFFARGEFDGLVITDSVPLPASMRGKTIKPLALLDTAGLVAEAIARAHRNR